MSKREAHVRADEGLKRGPKPRAPTPWPARPPANRKLPPDFDPRVVIRRYLAGDRIAEQAAELGVHPVTLNYHLLKDETRELWRAAQVAVALADKQEAEEVIRGAPDALLLARAREILRSSDFYLERLSPTLFGQSQLITHEAGPVLTDRLRRAEARVIEAAERIAAAGSIAGQSSTASGSGSDRRPALLDAELVGQDNHTLPGGPSHSEGTPASIGGSPGVESQRWNGAPPESEQSGGGNSGKV